MITWARAHGFTGIVTLWHEDDGDDDDDDDDDDAAAADGTG